MAKRTVPARQRSHQDELKAQVAVARGLSDTYLLCRLVGHSWARIIPDRVPTFGRIVVWECGRCGTKRDDIVQAIDGHLLQRMYRYAEGYTLKKSLTNGEDRGGRMVSVSALRIALMIRDDEFDAKASGAAR